MDLNEKKRIAPIFILKKYRGRGYAQGAIKEVERIHGDLNWQLDTILEEEENTHLYEKMGYHKTGRLEKINDKMTIVYFQK